MLSGVMEYSFQIIGMPKHITALLNVHLGDFSCKHSKQFKLPAFQVLLLSYTGYNGTSL